MDESAETGSIEILYSQDIADVDAAQASIPVTLLRTPATRTMPASSGFSVQASY
jgi:hypothetical protein